MELGESVNSEPFEGDTAEEDALPALAAPGAADYGPCLYLGPSGERCNRRALEGGFCERHQAGAAPFRLRTIGMRRLVALLAALGALMPLIADFIREIVRLLR